MPAPDAAPGDSLPQIEVDAWQDGEIILVDAARDAPRDLLTPDVAPPVCAPAGVKAACDPIAVSGCALGSCYVLRDLGTACVCPTGTLGSGWACMTTPDCQPGHVCSGDTPPGVCRRVCQTTLSCPKPMRCVAITQQPQWGLCDW